MRPLRIAAISLLVLYAAFTAYVSLGPLLGFPTVHGHSVPWLTLIATGFAITHALTYIGWRNTFTLFALTYTVSLLFETIGVATGWIYGAYHYTEQLGPLFLGLVPYLIPFAWFMISYPSLVIAEGILGYRSENRWYSLRVAALAAVVMTAWDLVLDPIMVKMGHWVWEVEGAYFGVPLHNFLGWLVTTFSIFILYKWIAGRQAHKAQEASGQSFQMLASGSYASTVAGNT
ncbi:MAG TPA: carotenoid biosynthesis protein, partial [Anaerolineales bacterium]|nr:carotenoid biosynthesis protein [Anaerolineales bacterium]